MKLNKIYTQLAIILATLALMLCACNAPTNTPTMAPAEATAIPTIPAAPASTATMAAQPTETAAPTQAPATNGEQSPTSATLDISGLAQNVTSQVVAAVAPGADAASTDVMPQYTLLTLQGYPISFHLKTAQVFVYPVKDLGVNEVAAKVAASLQTLLQTQQAGDQLPYLPLEFSAKQAIRSQVKYLDFKNGQGVRFLTEWHNGLAPIDNYGLIYTYQGLTRDGQYYVAAVLPVNLQGLPVDANDTSRLPTDFQQDYLHYLADTTSLLDQNPVGAYTPDLGLLDAMMQSIEVK
jgi:hypothetical protein